MHRSLRTFADNDVVQGSHDVTQSLRALAPLEQYEADFIADLLRKYQGNRKLVAAEMNISERTLYRKLNRLNLN
jgi:transcriptional regulator with PAS, ATPase and Fis domain